MMSHWSDEDIALSRSIDWDERRRKVRDREDRKQWRLVYFRDVVEPFNKALRERASARLSHHARSLGFVLILSLAGVAELGAAPSRCVVHRSRTQVHRFEVQTGYPHGRPGYVVDHIIPLCACGVDAPSNMQWQTIAAAKAKDKLERAECRHLAPQPTHRRTKPRHSAVDPYGVTLTSTVSRQTAGQSRAAFVKKLTVEHGE